MALTKEDLQAIRAVVKEEVQEQLFPIREDIEQIKEDVAITREATNSLIAWADEVAVISQIKFPVKKAK